MFSGDQIARSDLTVTSGSAVLGVDSDGDGNVDGTITLQGDFSSGDFMTVVEGRDTRVTFEPFLPTLTDGAAVAQEARNGIINQAFLTGDGFVGFRVEFDLDTMAAKFDNAVGVYELDTSGAIVDVRLLVNNVKTNDGQPLDITGVEAGHELGFFIIQDGADWANALQPEDALSFLDAGDGGQVLAVNGSAANVTVFHSFDAAFNPDGLTHQGNRF